MMFEKRFESADEFITHTDKLIGAISDPLLQQKYLGFIAVNAVTVYELAIKDIIFNFCGNTHDILLSFSKAVFNRTNGRISIDDLRNRHLSKFGDSYVRKFECVLEDRETELLSLGKGSIKSSYGNIISWRNKFAHEGEIPVTPNYSEVKSAYSLGKQVIYCLDKSL